MCFNSDKSYDHEIHNLNGCVSQNVPGTRLTGLSQSHPLKSWVKMPIHSRRGRNDRKVGAWQKDRIAVG